MSSVPSDLEEPQAVDPCKFIAPLDLEAMRERARVKRPSTFEMRQAWDDRNALLAYLDTLLP